MNWKPIKSAPRIRNKPVYVYFFAGGSWRIDYVVWLKEEWLSQEFGVVTPHSWMDIYSI